jgi:hypothetical protein
MNYHLLPYRFKWLGLFLVLAGLAGLVFYLWFDFIVTIPVFALVTSYLETSWFTIIRTNIADELIMLLLTTGFSLICFSRERKESENLDHIRATALWKAVMTNTIFLLFSILFIYGNGFLAVILLNLFSLFIFYLAFFYFLKRKE